MLLVWSAILVLFAILPFELIDKNFSYEGLMLLYINLLVFILGSLLPFFFNSTNFQSNAVINIDQADFKGSFTILKLASLITIICGLLDLSSTGSIFDLALAYELRSQQSASLLAGADSSSSIWFKIAFLTYPASYAFICMHTLYANPISKLSLAIYGFLPIIITTLALGGRATVFYAFLIFVFAFIQRAKIFHRKVIFNFKSILQNKFLSKLIFFIVFCLMSIYFISVFLIRAEIVGGPEEMFGVAESIWGVGFSGPLAELMFDILGSSFTYLVFVFNWYIVQGLVMGNVIFTEYNGPLLMGVYGFDIVGAIIRRLNPEFISIGFDGLLSINVYGFLPSAWGSLYVDFHYFGLIFVLFWGFLAGYVYKKIAYDKRQDWIFIGPYITLGILFSTINTPLGFANGLIIHLWAFFILFISRKRFGILKK